MPIQVTSFLPDVRRLEKYNADTNNRNCSGHILTYVKRECKGFWAKKHMPVEGIMDEGAGQKAGIYKGFLYCGYNCPF